MKTPLLWVAILTCSIAAVADPTLKDLNEAIEKSQWDDGVEISHEILRHNPKSSEAKLKGAYALFQKGYANSALNLLRTLSAQDWKSLPQGRDRFVEVVALFQKKVPLSSLPWKFEQIELPESSSYMSDELKYLKGRAAYEKRQNESAKSSLESVSKNSRFYVMARYLLGSIYAEEHDYAKASAQFSEVFQPTILDQSTEFWKDVGAQMTSHWGTNFKVLLDTEILAQTQRVAELSLLALARVAYASKDFDMAANRYTQIPEKSLIRNRAVLEKIWTLWALNRHAEAQKVAAELALDGTSFYTIKARVIRSLVLVDNGQTEEARKELATFDEIYNRSKNALISFQQRHIAENLPDFIKADIDEDAQLRTLKEHQESLDEEIKSLRAEDIKSHPAYGELPTELELWKKKNQSISSEIIAKRVSERIKDLDRLHIQSKLIIAETFLEDREQLKTKIKALKITDEPTQRKYDEELIVLLTKAIHEIEESYQQLGSHKARLQFRQAELLWELGTAKLILSQASSSKEASSEGDKIRAKALNMIEDLAEKETHFSKYDQVLFFKGFAELELNHTDKAIQTFHKYVRDFPKHEHVPDGYRILGDLSFDENHFAEAENYYRKVLEFPDSPLVGYALYKLGWCAYNEKNFARSLLALEKAYLWTAESAENKLIGLQKETRHDLVSIYAEVGDDHKAQDYFKRFSSNGGIEWLKELTKQYENGGQSEKAQNIYRTLIQMNPNSQDNMVYLSGIIQANYKLQKWDQVIANLKELTSKYGSQLSLPQGPTTAEWAIEKTIREVATVHQFEFRSSDSADVISQVITINNLYFNEFKRWPSTQEPLYRFAQYLNEKGHIKEAKEAFKDHWVQFQDSLKEPLKEEALRNLISTLGLIDEKTKNPVDTTPEATDIFTYSEQYKKIYSKTKYIRPIEFLYASTLLKYKKTEAGLTESQMLYDTNGGDEVGKNSFKNLSKTYYDLKDWKRTYEWASNLKKPDNQIQIIKEESYFLWAENISNDAESAHLFLKIARDPNMKKYWEKSLYNAFVRLNRAGNKFEALEAANLLERVNPKDSSLRSLAGLRAAIYQEAGDYKNALPRLEEFLSTTDAKTPQEVLDQSHLNLALIAEAVGLLDKAKQNYKLYLSNAKAGHKEEAERGLNRVAALQSGTGQAPFSEWAKVLREKEDFVKKPLIPQKDLVAELKSGVERLQKLTEHFLKLSNDPKTPTFYSVEIYCSVPFLYAAYSRAVRLLGGHDQDLKKELEKVAAPIDKKMYEFAQGCVDGALKTENGGPVYEEVIEKWGWKKDLNQRKKVSSALALLEKRGFWLEPLGETPKESDIITNHLKGNLADKLSWLKLARIRFSSGQLALSRLTYIDALGREPNSSALLNGLACVEQKQRRPLEAMALYKKAAELGSQYALVNQAVIHLRESRLGPALDLFNKALLTPIFDNDPKLKDAVKELTGP